MVTDGGVKAPMVAASLTIVTWAGAAGAEDVAGELDAAGPLPVDVFEPEQAPKMPTARRAIPTAGSRRSVPRLMGDPFVLIQGLFWIGGGAPAGAPVGTGRGRGQPD